MDKLYFDPEIGEWVYSAMPDLPDGWDMDECERLALRDEWSAGIGWSDCR